MAEKVELPTYETLLVEAMRNLAVDSGTVTSPAAVDTNTLNDATKNWASNVHKNRLVKIIRGLGAGQMAVISGNSAQSLVIKQTWAVRLDTTSVYVILEKDTAQIVRDVLGAGANVDIVAEFDKLKEALRTLTEASVDTGIADDTSTVNFLDDSSKNWPASPGGFENLIVEITEGAGEGQFAKIASNTATRITFVSAMSVIPDSTSKYRIGFFGKMAGDITAWGGTALTGRDISLDLANLDITLSAFRDALRGASTKDFSTLEADVEGILTQMDITLSALKAVGAETPRTLSNLYDQLAATLARDITQIGGTAQTGADWTLLLQSLDVALSTRAAEATLAKVIPMAKADIFNTALPAAEADWLGADITPTNSPSYLRIYVCVAAAGVLRVARTTGGTTVTEDLNGGASLTANSAYMFTVPWRSGDRINTRYSVTGANIKRLLIDEIGGAE